MYIVVVGSVVWLHILLGPYWCVCVCGALLGMKLTTHTHTNTDLIKYAPTPPNQLQRCALTGHFNNYNFSKLK
jgi:hypothetical protein